MSRSKYHTAQSFPVALVLMIVVCGELAATGVRGIEDASYIEFMEQFLLEIDFVLKNTCRNEPGRAVKIMKLLEIWTDGDGVASIPILKVVTWNILGNLYRRLNNLKKAYTCLAKAAKTLPKVGNRKAGLTYLNMCMVYSKTSK